MCVQIRDKSQVLVGGIEYRNRSCRGRRDGMQFECTHDFLHVVGAMNMLLGEIVGRSDIILTICTMRTWGGFMSDRPNCKNTNVFGQIA